MKIILRLPNYSAERRQVLEFARYLTGYKGDLVVVRVTYSDSSSYYGLELA